VLALMLSSRTLASAGSSTGVSPVRDTWDGPSYLRSGAKRQHLAGRQSFEQTTGVRQMVLTVEAYRGPGEVSILVNGVRGH
jgi:hypothetical protein